MKSWQVPFQNNITLYGQLNGLTKSPKITEHVNPYLAAIYAYNIVGKTLIFSEDKMTDFQQQFEEHVKNLSVSRKVEKFISIPNVCLRIF